MATHWHIIRCTSGQEGKAERYLERMGYPHGWHPTERIRLSETRYQRIVRAWEKLAKHMRGNKPARYERKPYVTGYVFLPTDHIDVDKIKRGPSGVWMDPLVVNGRLCRMTDDTMAAMRQVPERIKEMMDDIERQRREEWEAKRPQVGRRAKVLGGALEGHTVTVMAMRDGLATVDAGGLFGLTTVAETILERAA